MILSFTIKQSHGQALHLDAFHGNIHIKDLLDYFHTGNKKDLQNVDCNAVLYEEVADFTSLIKSRRHKGNI